jgi:hypothetical protein
MLAMKNSPRCHDCERLEREYERILGEIYSVVGGRFKTIDEKLRELWHWQDTRDKVLKAVYKHKGAHSAIASALDEVA